MAPRQHLAWRTRFVSRSLFVPICGSNFRCLGLLKPGVRIECIKFFFVRRDRFHGSQVHFVFLEASGPDVLLLAALETGLKGGGFFVV